VFVAFALIVGAHCLVLARLARDTAPGEVLPVLLAGAALFGLGALALAWGGLVGGHGGALVGALAALALYSAGALLVSQFPHSDPAAPNDDLLPRIAAYLALLWALALIGVASRRRGSDRG